MIPLLLALCSPPAQAAGLLYTPGSYAALSSLDVDVVVQDRIATATARYTWDDVTASAHGFTAVLPEDAAVIGLAYTDGGGDPVTATAHPAGDLQPVDAPDDDLDSLLLADGLRTFHVALPALSGGAVQVELVWQRIVTGTDGALALGVPLADGGLNPEAAAVDIRWAVSSEVEVVDAGLFVDDAEQDEAVSWDATGLSASWAGNLDNADRVSAAWQESADALDLRVLAWRPDIDPYTGQATPDGYALLIVRPGGNDERVQQLFTFVLDISSSMQGEPLETAVEAGATWLGSLDTEDRFNLLPYASQPYPFRGRAPLAEARKVDRGVAFLRKQTAAGLSDPEEALRTAFELSADTVNQRDFLGCNGTRQSESLAPRTDAAIVATGDRRLRLAPYVVWLTDGGASTGRTDPDGIAQALLDANREGASLFAIGVGGGVDSALLQRLTADHRGESALVDGPDQVAEAVALLRERIADPLLVRPVIQVDDVDAIAPDALADLTRGHELVIAFRWSEDGERSIELTGMQGQQDLDQSWAVSLPGDEADASSSVALAWAQLRVADLDSRYLAGDSSLYSEIEALVRSYGVASDVVTLSFDDVGEAGDATADGAALVDVANDGGGCSCSSRTRIRTASPYLWLPGMWLGLAWLRRRVPAGLG